VFRHMLEANDTFLIARYNVHYANTTDQPTQPIDLTFDFIWHDSDHSEIANTSAYAFNNYGYGKGAVAFYLEAGAPTEPDWGNLGNVTVRGTSLFDAPAPEANYTLTSGDWTPYSSPADIREDLRQYIIANSLFLELDWNSFWADLGMEERQIDLLMHISPDYTVLSPSGEGYWTNTIDDLRDMCPLLFMLQITEPTYVDEEHPQTQAGNYSARYEDTPVEDFKSGLSGFFGGIGEQTVGTMLVMLAMMAIAAFYAFKWNKPMIGFLGAVPAGLISILTGIPYMPIMVAVIVALPFLTFVATFFFKPGAG